MPVQMRLIYICLFGLVNISGFYVNLFILLPRFFKRGKLGFLALSWIALIVVYAAFTNYLSFILAPYVPHDYKIYRGFLTALRQGIFLSGFFIFISTLYKLVEDWFLNEKIRIRLEKEKLKAELSFLRSQINPHFLFNTLNNIYTLAYQKSDKAPDAVGKLSAIMRYMLYESMDAEVTLEKELAYLEQFINLQALRVKDGLKINVAISGDTSKVCIAPLMLINFVENAFKHGVLDDGDNPVILKVNADQDKLYFFISNKVLDGNKDQQKGIGLKNVQRRLDLLYPKRHQLKTGYSKNIYTAELYLTATH